MDMSLIKSKNTKPEIIVRRYLHNKGLRYLLHDRRLPGKPDLVFPKHRTIVFVHGCFWHAHEGCKYNKLPKGNQQYWRQKIGNNKIRDDLQVTHLRNSGWKVLTIWECETVNQRLENSLYFLYQSIIN